LVVLGVGLIGRRADATPFGLEVGVACDRFCGRKSDWSWGWADLWPVLRTELRSVSRVGLSCDRFGEGDGERAARGG